MSTDAAIGAVSRTLQSLLLEKLDLDSAGPDAVAVTIGLPPEHTGETEPARVNVFLYRICENGALANQEPPGRGERGAYGKPPLSLNLHYLLTAYGTSKQAKNSFEDEVMAHYLLGSAMRILHDFAIVVPALRNENDDPILDSSLHGALERVKVSLEPISLEDLSKVWTALSRPFRASAAYAVTVVQVEPRVRAKRSQPVGPESVLSGPHIHAVAGLTPSIGAIHAAGRVGAQVCAGETLVLEGEGLLGDLTRIDIDGIPEIGQATSARSDRLTLIVPDDARLAAGIHSLRISHGVKIGAPPQRRSTFTSNTVAFALVPRVDEVSVSGTPPVVEIKGDRLRAEGVECLALVGGETVEDGAYGAGSTATSITFPLPTGLAPGQEARVFVRVNGAQSIETAKVTIP